MTPKTARLLGRLFLLVSLLPALVGTVLVLRAGAMPPFTDKARAYKLMHDLPAPDDGAPLDAERNRDASREWHRAMAQVRTAKWEVHDLGWCLLTASGCLLALWAAGRLWDLRNAASARTPASRGGLLAWLALAWLWPIPATALRIMEEHRRFSFPTWADSIGVPILSAVLFFAATLPVLLLPAWILVRRGGLPARLWAWRADRPVRSWAGALVCAASLGVLAWAGSMAISARHHLLLPSVGALAYVVLCLRAAASTPRDGG